MPRMGFEPTTIKVQRAKMVHALDFGVAVIGNSTISDANTTTVTTTTTINNKFWEELITCFLSL
jgi:uncharacterized membrane protein YccF (DUF307 family)